RTRSVPALLTFLLNVDYLCIENRCEVGSYPRAAADCEAAPGAGERMKGRKEQKDLLPGTLEMLILQTLRRGALHGYAIAQHIQQTSKDVLQVEEGSLYPALQRLLREGWVMADWGIS